jgi:probable rRNA maturation factor
VQAGTRPAREAPQPKLSLSVQYASEAASLPTRPQFRRWVGTALQQQASVTLRIVDADEGRTLNRDYRGKDYATNVLTFAYGEEDGMLAGDIVLCAPVVEKEALEQGKALLAHYAHLTVHGVLHMQGYEHETEAEASKMEALEVAILRRLRFNSPYESA